MQENKSLGDKFAGFTSEPSPEVWENIERSLDEKSPRRRFFAWWQLVLAVGIFAGALVWTFKGETGRPDVEQISSKANTDPKLTEKKVPAEKQASTEQTALLSSNDGNEPSPDRSRQAESEFNVSTAKTAGRSNAGSSMRQKAISEYRDIAIFTRRSQDNTSPRSSEPTNETNRSETASKATASDKQENQADNSLATPDSNPGIEIAQEDLLSAKDVTKTDSLHSQNVTDSSVISRQETNTQILTEPKMRRWELQFQIGTLASGKQEMWITPSQPYYEGTVNVGNGGFSPISLGNSPELKHYRNITSNYGVLVSYNFSNRWRLTTGLSYLRYYTHILEDRTLHAGAHYFQVPAIADLTLIHTSKWEWSIGSGMSLGHVSEKSSATDLSSWRSDFLVQTSMRYALSQRFTLQLQPQARFISWDQQTGKAGKLSPWYWGGNLGAVWRF